VAARPEEASTNIDSIGKNSKIIPRDEIFRRPQSVAFCSILAKSLTQKTAGELKTGRNPSSQLACMSSENPDDSSVCVASSSDPKAPQTSVPDTTNLLSYKDFRFSVARGTPLENSGPDKHSSLFRPRQVRGL
jgi:hypothetical protein